MGGLISRDRLCGYGINRRLALHHLLAQLQAAQLKPKIISKHKLEADRYREMKNEFFRVTTITGRWTLENPDCVQHDVVILVGRNSYKVTCYRFEKSDYWLCVGIFNHVKCKGHGLTLIQSIYNMFIEMCVAPNLFSTVTDRRTHTRAIVNGYSDPYVDIGKDATILLSVRLKKDQPRCYYTIQFETASWPDILKTELRCCRAVLVNVDFYIHEG